MVTLGKLGSAPATPTTHTDAKHSDSGEHVLRDGSVAFTGDQSLGTHKLTDVVDPVSNQDAATKKYVDDVVIQVSYGGTLENPTNAEDLTLGFTNRAITVTEIRVVLLGSSTPSVTWTIRHHATDRSNAGSEVVTGGTTTTSTTAGSDVTSFNDATIPADSFIWLETTAKSGTVTELHVTMIGTVD